MNASEKAIIYFKMRKPSQNTAEEVFQGTGTLRGDAQSEKESRAVEEEIIINQQLIITPADRSVYVFVDLWIELGF